MQRRFRKVCTSLKEKSHISYAKIASAAGLSDMNIIIIKATSPDDIPVDEKYIQHLLKLFSISPSTSCHSFAISFTRRFGTTHSWRVALKSLILLHRLIRSVQGNSPLWTQLLWTRSNGLISLYPCHFKDASSSSPSFSYSYTNFIISYARLLDQALNCVTSLGYDISNTKFQTIKEMGEMLHVLPQLQSIIDRGIDCYPMGVAGTSFIVQSAMKHIIRDSFVCYTKFRREIVVLLDSLFQMPYSNCIATFNIYKKSAVQTNRLKEFYERCKVIKGLCGYYEYPLLEPIPHIKIKTLESILSGMWQLTESSSSSEETTSVFTEEDEVHHMINAEVFEEEVMRPLIELEDDNWETLLDSSISFSLASPVTTYNPFSIELISWHGRPDHNPNSYPWGL